MLRELIADEAADQGLDYKDLAELTGLSRATIHRYLTGVRDMTGERLDMLLGALRIDLFGEAGGRTSRSTSRRKRLSLPQQEKIQAAADYCEIHECDFRKLRVKARSVNLIATDVPWTLKAVDDWVAFGKCAKRWLRPNGLCAVLIGTSALNVLIPAIEKGGLNYQWVFPIFFKTPTADNNGVFSLWRPVVIFAHAKMHRFGGKRDLLTNDGAEKQFHPHQQPVLPFKQVIKRLTEPGDLVVDCFMGTGTTAVACMTAEGGRRRFIGCDHDPAMMEFSRERLGITHQDS